MIQILCFLIPSFISGIIFEKIQRKQFNIKNFLAIYMILTGIISMFYFGVITVFFQHPNWIVNADLFSVLFVIEYLFLSSVIALGLPCLYGLWLKYHSFKKWNCIHLKTENCIVYNCQPVFSFTVIVFTPYDMFLNKSVPLFAWRAICAFCAIEFVSLEKTPIFRCHSIGFANLYLDADYCP